MNYNDQLETEKSLREMFPTKRAADKLHTAVRHRDSWSFNKRTEK